MKRAVTCNPTKMWIDGKCFEIKRFQRSPKKLANCRKSPSAPIIEVPSAAGPTYEIMTNEEGLLYTSFRLPSHYYTKLSNFPHLDIKMLEHSTKTTIVIPDRDQEAPVVITGESEETVIEARHEIHSVVGEIRNQFMPMQFIAIPTRSEEVIGNFNNFKADILNGEKINGMHDTIFQKPKKLHLTVGVFTLLESEKDEGIRALQNYKNEILDPLIKKTGPLKIQISGIGCMGDNVKRTNVLYANAKIVEERDDVNLQEIVNMLSNYFYHRGLMKDYQDNVKLHMTLINTKYRKTPGSPQKNKWSKRESFDATAIMNKYKDFNFGICEFNSVRLSWMSSEGPDGFYRPLAEITLD